MSKVRLVFAGTGYMGQIAHLQNYIAQSDVCEVVSVADVRESVAQQVAQRYGVKKYYKDMYEMLEKEEYDGIICIQGFNRHIALLPDVVKYGKPVMIEKPLALNYEVGLKIVDMAKKYNTKIMIGYHKRSDPASEYAKKLVDQFKASKEHGEMTEVRITMANGNWGYCGVVPGVINNNEPFPYCDVEKGNPLLTKEQQGDHEGFVNYYIHQMNYMRFMMGEPYEVDYVSKDGALMVCIGKKTGVKGVLEMCPYESSPEWEELIKVMFNKAYVKVSLPAPLTKYPGKVEVRTTKEIFTPLFEANYAMLNQASNFIKVVKGEAEAPCWAEEAAEDLRNAFDLIKMKYGIK